MTLHLVDTHTGELVESLTHDEARRLTDRIRLIGGSLADTLDKLAALIDEARTGSAWLALGYRSWPEYVSSEFADVLPRLDREPRQEFVRELASQGMSVRAIAPVVGVGIGTVSRDLNSPVPNGTPETSAASAAEPEAAPEEGMARAAEPVESTAAPEGEVVPTQSTAEATPPSGTATPRPPVTGLDGKTYTPPTPRPPKPVLDGQDAEYANAEKASLALSRAISKLLEFQHSNMREGMRKYWSMASNEVPPTPRRDVTPEQMRVAAQGLLTLADEWDD